MSGLLMFLNQLQMSYIVTNEGGVVVWVVGDATIDGSETGSSFRQALYFQEIGFKIFDTMIYQKTGTPFPQKVRYNQVFEYMFVFSKGVVFKNIQSNIKTKQNRRCIRNSRKFRNKEGERGCKVINQFRNGYLTTFGLLKMVCTNLRKI